MDLGDTASRMQKAVDAFGADVGKYRTGRASSSMVEDIIVQAYGGTRMRVMELGSVNVSDSQTIVISAWDASTLGDIRKGIMEANVGLNPIVDNGVLRIAVPPLTGERRQELIKSLGQRKEEAKVGIRNVRHDEMGKIKRALEEKEITEDDRDRMEKQLQDETDKHIAKIEEIATKKEKELAEI